MNKQKETTPPLEQRQVLNAINFVMVSLMLACFAFLLGEIIQILYPEWPGALFPILAFLIALESLIVSYTQRTGSQITHNLFLSTLSEIVLILLIIKLLSMILSGFSTIWLEILSWQRDFFRNFFDTQYLVRVFGLLTIWAIARLFSEPLNRLEEDEILMAQEKLGYTFTDRQDARRSLITSVFFLGFIMIVMMVILKSDWVSPQNEAASSGALVSGMVIYFFAGFVLLALNQYAIMKARWYFNEISVNPDLAKRWLLYTLAFILLVTLIIIFLPTGISIGFSPFIRIVSDLFIYLFAIIQFIFALPIAFILSLINAFISGQPLEDEVQETIPEMVPVVPRVTPSLPWLDIVRTILFWLVFLGVIIFSIRYYLNNRQDFKSFLSSIKIGTWLQTFWLWIKQGFTKVRQTTSDAIQKGVKNVRAFLRERRIQLPSLTDLARRLPPRQSIILAYVDWIHWNQQQGFKRTQSQTPLEYAQSLQQFLPESAQTITEFTQTFIAARYSRQEIKKAKAQEALDMLVTLKHNFQQKLSSGEADL